MLIKIYTELPICNCTYDKNTFKNYNPVMISNGLAIFLSK